MRSEGLTRTIIGAAMEVHRVLGPGFLETIYKKALLHELGLRGLSTTAESFEVWVAYKGQLVGKHRLDVIVNDEVIVELKAIVSGIHNVHVAQALAPGSYMKARAVPIGLVVNFGEESLTWKWFRLVR